MAGQAATGFNFAELGLQAKYVAAYFGRAFFTASTPSVSNLNLTAGSVYFALSGVTQGTFTATAQSSGQGSTQLTLYNRAMQPLASETIVAGQTQTDLTWNLDQGAAARVGGFRYRSTRQRIDHDPNSRFEFDTNSRCELA